MDKIKTKVILFLLLVIFFLTGFFYRHYMIFPSKQFISLIINTVNTLSITGRKAVAPPMIKEPTFILDTSLQRLLIKKVHLNQGKDIGRGGTATNIDYNVFINSNEDSDNKELIEVYNLKNHIRYHGELRIPMNYSALLSSPMADIPGFDLFRFRVTGLYGEKINDNTYTLFATHNNYEQDRECISFNLSKINISLTNGYLTQLSNWKTIFTATPCIYPKKNTSGANPFPGHMAGGRIIEYDNKTLLVSIGSFSVGMDEQVYFTADSTSSFGKFLLIDKSTGEDSIYAIGSRNSQGLLKSSNGTIWATDHGPQGGDEINIIRKGGNYGWPNVSYGIQYGNEAWALADSQGRHDGFDKPVFVWMTAIAPTNIIEITGESFSEWKGDLLIGSLTGRSLHRVRIEDDDRIIYNEVIHLGYRIRDILVLPDEKIILHTDEGSLFIIEDGGAIFNEIDTEIKSRIKNLEMFDVLLDQVPHRNYRIAEISAANIYNIHCATCHYIDEIHDVGPHLGGLFNREVGGLDDYNYSNVLKESNAVWSGELLRSFLLYPEITFPNSRMVQIPLKEAEADSIVTYLKNET